MKKDCKIRYSRVPYKYGTKNKLPKYALGTDYLSVAKEDEEGYDFGLNALDVKQQEELKNKENKNNTNKQLANTISSGAETYLSTQPYYAAASTASGVGKSMLKKNQTVNPVTGEVTEGFASEEDQFLDNTFTPHHTKMIDDVSKGDYLGAVMHSNTGTGIVYDLIKNGGSFRDKSFDEAQKKNEQLQKDIDTKNQQIKQKAEDKQRDVYSRAYLTQNPATGVQGASLYAYGTYGSGNSVVPYKKGSSPLYDFQNHKTWKDYTAIANKNGRRIEMSAYGTQQVPGGELKTLATGIKKAQGDTHEQDTNKDGKTGIILKNNQGQDVAEVENNEILTNDGKVLSDRLPFTGKKTFAQEGEKLAKEKAKNEELFKKGSSIGKQTAGRNLEKLESKFQSLLSQQDIVRESLGLKGSNPIKMAYGGKIPKYFIGTNEDENPPYETGQGRRSFDDSDFDGEISMKKSNFKSANGEIKGDLTMKDYEPSITGKSSNKKTNSTLSTVGNILGNASPYLDNIVNAQLIKQTPKINKPITRVAQDEKAFNLKTNYDISQALNANQSSLRAMDKNIKENTASSNDARANMLAGFSSKLTNDNQLYNTKENTETQLKNNDILNKQGVYNRNQTNRQNVNFTNNSLTDEYNWKNVLRNNDIRGQKSILAKETSEDLMNSTKDKREENLDHERILYNSLKYDDAAGVESLIGTPTMNKMMKDPVKKRQYLEMLKNSKQESTKKKFLETYGE